jgi:hypothetical protein
MVVAYLGCGLNFPNAGCGLRLNLLRLLAFDALWGDWLRIVQLWAGSMSLRMAVPVFFFASRALCTFS